MEIIKTMDGSNHFVDEEYIFSSEGEDEELTKKKPMDLSLQTFLKTQKKTPSHMARRHLV